MQTAAVLAALQRLQERLGMHQGRAERLRTGTPAIGPHSLHKYQ